MDFSAELWSNVSEYPLSEVFCRGGLSGCEQCDEEKHIGWPDIIKPFWQFIHSNIQPKAISRGKFQDYESVSLHVGLSLHVSDKVKGSFWWLPWCLPFLLPSQLLHPGDHIRQGAEVWTKNHVCSHGSPCHFSFFLTWTLMGWTNDWLHLPSEVLFYPGSLSLICLLCHQRLPRRQLAQLGPRSELEPLETRLGWGHELTQALSPENGFKAGSAGWRSWGEKVSSFQCFL
jgi:hypothetical protein